MGLKKINIWWISLISHRKNFKHPTFNYSKYFLRKKNPSSRKNKIMCGTIIGTPRKRPYSCINTSTWEREENTQIKWGKSVLSFISQGMAIQKAICLKMLISTVTQLELTRNMFYGQAIRKFSFSALQHSRWVWCKKKNAYTENNLYASMVEVEVPWCHGAIFPPKALGTFGGYMASWTPWNTKTFSIWIWLPLPGNWNWVVIGSTSGTIIQNIRPNEHKIKILPWLCGLSWRGERTREEPRTLDDLGEIMYQRNGLRFLSLYSTTLLDVIGRRLHAVVLAKGVCTKY